MGLAITYKIIHQTEQKVFSGAYGTFLKTDLIKSDQIQKNQNNSMYLSDHTAIKLKINRNDTNTYTLKNRLFPSQFNPTFLPLT